MKERLREQCSLELAERPEEGGGSFVPEGSESDTTKWKEKPFFFTGPSEGSGDSLVSGRAGALRVGVPSRWETFPSQVWMGEGGGSPECVSLRKFKQIGAWVECREKQFYSKLNFCKIEAKV